MADAASEHPPEEAPSSPLGPAGFLKHIAVFLYPYWARCILIFFLILMQSAYYIVLPICYKLIFDRVIGEKDGEFLVLILSGMLIGFVLVTLAELTQSYFSAGLGTDAINDIRLKMFNHLQRLSSGFYTRAQGGDLLSRFTNDLNAVEHAVTTSLYYLCFYTILSFLSVALLFFIEWRLALLTVLALPLGALGPKLFGSQATEAGHGRKQEEARVSSFVQENISAQKVIQAFGLHTTFLDKFQTLLAQLRGISVRMHVFSSFVGKVSNLGVILVQLMVIGAGSYLSIQGDLTSGALVGFIGLLINVGNSAKALTAVVPELIQGASGLQRIRELLDEQPEITDAEDALPMPRFSKEIRFENVSFSYTGKELNLDSISFTIPAGQSVAFVGPSGSGKSTVLTLITRNYDSSQGEITIDGEDIKQLSRDSLRSQIGSVFQDTFLFNTTIRENIRQGRLDATDGEVEEAAKAAEMHDLITGFPQGYDTQVGEGGGRLSGGQRQRIALARAILRDPTILILDEATSSLDPGTEAAVNTTVEKLAGNCTVASVTHRLAPIANMDRIFVLDKGKLVEQGPHEDLLNLKGVYYHLWQKQGGFTISEKGGVHARVEAKRLRAIPLFEKAEETLLEALAGRFVSERFDEGTTVIQEGEAGDKFYIIARGKVEVLTNAPQGGEILLGVLEDGDYFGEIALLEEEPRTATIRTLEESLLITLTRPQFEDLLDEMPELRPNFDRVVRERRETSAARLGEKK